MNRRQFLKNSALYSGGFATMSFFPYYSALGEILSGKNTDAAFVLIVVPYGMDVALGLDPVVRFPDGIDDKDLFIEYKPEQIITADNGVLLGPAAVSMKGFDFSVINGIFMNDFDNGHDANRQYIKTGNGLGQAADISVALTKVIEQGPLGILTGSESPYMAKQGEGIATTLLNDISSWSKLGDPSSVMRILSANVNTVLTQSQKSVVALGPYRKSMVSKIDQLGKLNLNAAPSNDNLKSLIAALGCGAGRLAEVSISSETGQMDSHSDHAVNHLKAQKSAWEQIANILKMAKATRYKNTKDSVFDRTTFLVVSDFARTPYLNTNNGKDHNPNTNSVLLAGRGVKAGLTIGQSILTSRKHSYNKMSIHSGAPFDYLNGVSVLDSKLVNNKNIDFIYPENVIATVAACVGAKPDQLKSLVVGTPIISSLIKV